MDRWHPGVDRVSFGYATGGFVPIPGVNLKANDTDHDLLYLSVEYVSAWGNGGDDVLTGNDPRRARSWLPLVLRGGNGDDELTGGDGGDHLVAGSGSDILKGGKGNDDLYGQDGVGGNDSLYGGGGTDDCYADGSDSMERTANEGQVRRTLHRRTARSVGRRARSRHRRPCRRGDARPGSRAQ